MVCRGLIDETTERRRGAKITGKRIYRDPAHSSKEQFVKTGGLRWVSLRLLAPIPLVGHVRALVLAANIIHCWQENRDAVRLCPATAWGPVGMLRCCLPWRRRVP